MPNSEDSTTPAEFDGRPELEVLTTVLQALQDLPPEARLRVVAAVTSFFGIATPLHIRPSSTPSAVMAAGERTSHDQPSSFSQDRTPSPKEFLLEKRPQTDVERIACLAYYVTHYRGTPHFKTLDLSKLNTEAAQVKFSNASWAVDNATKLGYLVPATKGAKQISALGELYVQALPDQAAARSAVAHAKPRKRGRRSSKSAGQTRSPDEL